MRCSDDALTATDARMATPCIDGLLIAQARFWSAGLDQQKPKKLRKVEILGIVQVRCGLARRLGSTVLLAGFVD